MPPRNRGGLSVLATSPFQKTEQARVVERYTQLFRKQSLRPGDYGFESRHAYTIPFYVACLLKRAYTKIIFERYPSAAKHYLNDTARFIMQD